MSPVGRAFMGLLLIAAGIAAYVLGEQNVGGNSLVATVLVVVGAIVVIGLVWRSSRR